MRILNGLMFFVLMWFCTSCIDFTGDDDNDDGVSNVTEEINVQQIDEATLSYGKWKWGLAATSLPSGNTSSFVCTSDTIYGGYFALLQSGNTSLAFSFDEDFVVRNFSNMTGYIVQHGDGQMFITAIDDGRLSHFTYEDTTEIKTFDTPMESVAASILALCNQVDFVRSWFSQDLEMLLTAAIEPGSGILPGTAQNVYVGHYEDEAACRELNGLLRVLFGDAEPSISGFGVDGKSEKSVSVIVSGSFPSTSFQHGQAADSYGDEINNKVYCGLLVGDISSLYGNTPSILNLGNCLYNITPVPVTNTQQEITFVLPSDLSSGAYVLCPYLISSCEVEDMEAGYPINPHLIRYCSNPYHYYNIEASIENITQVECLYDETSGLSAHFRVSASINPGAEMEQYIGNWEIIVRRNGDVYNNGYIKADEEKGFTQTLEFSQQIYKGDCNIDEVNYRATCDLEFLIYVDVYPYVHYFAPRNYTAVYDEKPSIRYTEARLETALCTVNDHNVMESSVYYEYEVKGAFWLDDGLVTYWDDYEGGRAFMRDEVSGGNFFYGHFLFQQLKPATEYLMATRNGREFPSSNHLAFTWSGETVTSVEIAE